MGELVYTCYHCKARFVFPDGISDKIISYLLKKGYEQFQCKNPFIFQFKKGKRSIVVFTDPSDRDFRRCTMDALIEIAESENRPPQVVLSDILYDDEANQRTDCRIGGRS